MRFIFTRSKGTCAKRLIRVLQDTKWHSTRELVRRVGHDFGVAKFHLVRRGYDIRRRFAAKPNQYEYRLISTPRERDDC